MLSSTQIRNHHYIMTIVAPTAERLNMPEPSVDNDAAPIRGVVIGIILVVPFWVLLLSFIYWLFTGLRYWF
jgi:hypothetical protein